MDAIILFSHGSLLCGSGKTLLRHADFLRRAAVAPIVEPGYLNYTEPSFAEAAAACAARGASRIIVTPYFLVPGYFVETALPKCIAQISSAYPNIEFKVAQPIGYDDRMVDAVLQSAESAIPNLLERPELLPTEMDCRAIAECPFFGTHRCPKQPAPLENGTAV